MVNTCISKIYTRQHERCEKLIYSWVYCFYFQGSEVPEVQPDVTNTNLYLSTNGASVLQKKPLQVSNQVTTKLDGGVSQVQVQVQQSLLSHMKYIQLINSIYI